MTEGKSMNKLPALASGFVLLMSQVAWAAEADNWPRFRGPNGAGTSDATTLPVQWTEKDYNWKVELPGGGHSSPVVWGDRLFVTSGLDDTGRRIIQCFKTADGSPLWKREYESATCKMNGLNSYATVTPAADKDYLFVTWAVPAKYTVVALDHEGREVWQRDLGPWVSQHGHGASPIVFEDLVIVPNDQDGKSFVVALDRKTGQVRWQTDRKSGRAAYATPCIYRPLSPSPEVILASLACGMTGIDVKTGKVNWEIPDVFPAPKRVVASPVIAGGLVLAQCGEGGAGLHVVAVRPPAWAGEKPAVAWKVTKSAPYVPMPVIKGDRVFFWSDSGTASCVRLVSGEEVWREKIGGTFYASPLCVGGRIYNISAKGEMVVLAATDKYELLARNNLGEKCHATPAIAGGRMYLRTWSHLMSIGGK
jgi:outer membrane protein assembly factor BamB